MGGDRSRNRIRLQTLGLALAAIAAAIGSTDPAAAYLFRKIADTQTLIPGGGGAFFNFNNSDLPAISGDRVVFRSTDKTIWTATKAGQGLMSVITTQDRIPGGWGKFHQGSGNSVAIDGDTVIINAQQNCICDPIGIFTRLFSGGRIRKIVDRNDTNANFPGVDKTFGTFGSDFRVRDGAVVFTNRQQVFSSPIIRSNVTAVAGPQDQGSQPPSPYCCLFDSPSVKAGKMALRGGTGLGVGSVQTVRKNGDPGSFRIVASENTHAPRTPAGYRFDPYKFWGVVLDDTVVFGGASSKPSNPTKTGIYSSANGLTRLADTNMAVPGGTGNFNFAWSGNTSPILASGGLVVFGATDSANVKAIFVVKQTGGKIRRVIGVGDIIKGFTVGDLLVSRHGLSGGNLAFAVSYGNVPGFGLYSTVLQ